MLATLHQFNLLLRKFLVGLQAGAKPRDLVGSQGHIDFPDLRTGGELAQRVNEDRRAPNLRELFGRRWLLAFRIGGGGHACTQPGRRNDHYDLHRGLQVYGPRSPGSNFPDPNTLSS